MCRQLGYVGALKFTQESTFGPVLGPFSYNNVKCHGTEVSINNCPHSKANNCEVNEGAGVICDPRKMSTTPATTLTKETIATAIITSSTSTQSSTTTTTTTSTIKCNFL